MEVRPGANPNDVKNYDTDRLRHDFLIQDVFVLGEIKTIYSQIDRIIVGSATPAGKALKLTAGDELRAAYFLERREMGVINIGGKGTMTLDGVKYDFDYKDGIYIGMGTKEVILRVPMQLILLSFTLTVLRHIRLILLYSLTLRRIFFLRIRRSLAVLRMLTTELSASIFFRDRLRAVSLRWV